MGYVKPPDPKPVKVAPLMPVREPDPIKPPRTPRPTLSPEHEGVKQAVFEAMLKRDAIWVVVGVIVFVLSRAT